MSPHSTPPILFMELVKLYGDPVIQDPVIKFVEFWIEPEKQKIIQSLKSKFKSDSK
jgi:hypothetical protein